MNEMPEVDEARIKELRSVIDTKTALIREGGQKAIKVDGDRVEIKQEDFDLLQKEIGEVEQVKTLIRAEMFGDEMAAFYKSLEQGGNSDGYSVAMKAAAEAQAAAMGGQHSFQMKSVGSRFTESEDFKQFKASGGLTMATPWDVQGVDLPGNGSWGQKDIFTGLLTGAVNPLGFGSVQFDPAVPRGQRANRVRSLFPVATTSANLIDFFRVLGWAENGGVGNAQVVPDRLAADGVSPATGLSTDVFALKPKSNLTFEAAQAPVRTIAHWEAAHRNVLDDEPQLRATIDNELLYGLALIEDDQILNGTGGGNLLGILNTPGVQQYVAPNNEIRSDSLRRAQTLSMIANYPSTGFVLHPSDWEQIELQKGTGDGQYMLVTNIAVGLTAQVWRNPVVETPAIAELTFLSGAFGYGAQLYDRQQANIRVSEHHQDFFVRNAIAILAEERLALAVKRPEAFVVGLFDN